jgi:hypothetical protein
MLARRRNVVAAVLVVVLVVAIVAAVSVWRARDPFDPAQPAAATDPASIAGKATPLSGTVEGSSVDYMPPWYAVLEVRTDDGRVVHVVLNEHSKITVGPTIRRHPGLGADESVFPYAVGGTRFSGNVKALHFGFLGLRSVPLAVSASFGHP